MWNVGLFSRPPADEPQVEHNVGASDTACASSSDRPEASTGDPISSVFAGHISCGDDDVSGWSYARGGGLEGVSVAEATSSVRAYRDPARGLVARVEFVARGVQLDASTHIDTIRGTAESWANGRQEPIAVADREAGYDPNRDRDRTAGTCFQRNIVGVRSPAYLCGPCGDEQALLRGLSAALGANARVRLRQPDEVLIRGSENGFVAAVVKPVAQRFSDLVLNNDLLQTALPTLEIIRYAPAVPAQGLEGNKGQQIYQFAGVEVSSSYGISCLLVYDEAATTCGAPAEPPGSIAVNLTDPDGKALAGGRSRSARTLTLMVWWG